MGAISPRGAAITRFRSGNQDKIRTRRCWRLRRVVRLGVGESKQCAIPFLDDKTDDNSAGRSQTKMNTSPGWETNTTSDTLNAGTHGIHQRRVTVMHPLAVQIRLPANISLIHEKMLRAGLESNGCTTISSSAIGKNKRNCPLDRLSTSLYNEPGERFDWEWLDFLQYLCPTSSSSGRIHVWLIV